MQDYEEAASHIDLENKSIQDSEIKAYLENNPQFFEQHPALLVDLYLPNPHGSGTISLAERQQLAQRDKIRVLESKFFEMVKMGSENEAISNKIHALTLGLLASQQFAILVQLLQHYLRAELDVPNSMLKIWATPKNATDANNVAFQDANNPDETILMWVQNLAEPYCGTECEPTIKSWFDESNQSFAVIPLRSDKVLGLLILASEDARRFYPEMGTMFLKRIGELVSASLLRYVN